MNAARKIRSLPPRHRYWRLALHSALMLCPGSLAAQPADSAPPDETALVLHRQIDISSLRDATVPFGTAGGWVIRIDQVGDFGCFMASQYDNTVGIRFQLSPADGSTMMWVGSTAWKSILQDERKELGLSFEGRGTWSGMASGVAVEGMHWLMLKGTGIIDEMQDARWFALKIDSVEFAAYDTGEVRQAVTLLRECQALADKAVVSPAGGSAPALAR